MGENVRKLRVFRLFRLFRPLNLIFRDNPTELPLILKLIKFQMQYMASFLSYLQSFRRYGRRQILSFKNAISFFDKANCLKD